MIPLASDLMKPHCVSASPPAYPDVVTASILQRFELFHGLDEVALHAVGLQARYRSVPRGGFFFHQQEPVTAIYVLLEGCVRLAHLTSEGRQLIDRYIVPGEAFALTSAVSRIPSSTSGQAVDTSLALTWDGGTLATLMEQHPRLALNCLRLLASRLCEFQDRVRELATERVERRVAHALLRLVRQTGRQVTGGTLVNLPLSRQDLADMTGTTLYTVSRTLKRWDDQGLIEAGRERVMVRDLSGLRAVAEGLPNLSSPERGA